MKLLRLILVLLLLAMPATAAELVTITITITNLPAGASSNLVIQGSTRYWTNSVTAAPGTSIQITNTTANSATQLLNHLTVYAPSVGAFITNSTATNVQYRGRSGETMAASVVGNWGFVTYFTQTVASPTYILKAPFTTETAQAKTNVASAAVSIFQQSTQAFGTNWAAVSNLLQKGVGPSQFTKSEIHFQGRTSVDSNFFATNGFTSALTNINPVTSNLVNYGNAIRSEGAGGNSFQAGSNAVASGDLTVALGNGARSYGTSDSAVGTGAIATNGNGVAVGTGAFSQGGSGVAVGVSASSSNGVAVGNVAGAANAAVGIGDAAAADGDGSIAIGSGANGADVGSIAIGPDSSATKIGSLAIGLGSASTYSNSAAIGPSDHDGTGVATTDTNQIRLGTAKHRVSIPGQLLISGTQSNTTFRGTNLFAGSLSFPRFDLTTLAAGNNISVPFGTNVYVRAGAAPASAASICGVIGAATSGGNDGQNIFVFNDTGFTLTFAVNTVDPVPANRFSGSDVSIGDQGWAQIVYDLTDARWSVVGTYPVTASATNAIAFLNGSGTNMNFYQSGSSVAVTVNPMIGSGTNRFQVLNTNSQAVTFVNSNDLFTASNAFVKGVLTNSSGIYADSTIFLMNGSGAIRVQLAQNADGRILLRNAAGTGWDGIAFGNAGVNFPYLARLGAGLNIVGATGAGTTTNNLYVSGVTYLTNGVFSYGLLETPGGITNTMSQHFLVETRLIPTNNALSNIVVNFALTNSVEMFCTNNLTFTNWSGLLTGVESRKTIIIRPQLIPRGVNWGNLGGANPGYSVKIYTNGNNLLWTTLTNAQTYALSLNAIGTNIFPTLTLWE